MIFKEKIANVASRPDFLYTYDVKYAFDIVDATNTLDSNQTAPSRSDLRLKEARCPCL
jgi:hypothetical protein